MKTNPFTKKTFGAVMIGAAMLLGTSSAFAQVKIGNNPTIIGTNNNLEVEGTTSGRKTSIHKTTGQVTIADGTEATGKVFTSDAVGGGSWQATKLVQATVNYINNGVATIINGQGGDGNIRITFPENGTYAVSFSYIADTENQMPFVVWNNWASVALKDGPGNLYLNHQDNAVPGSSFLFISGIRYVSIANAPITLRVEYGNNTQNNYTTRAHNSTAGYNDWFAYKVF